MPIDFSKLNDPTYLAEAAAQRAAEEAAAEEQAQSDWWLFMLLKHREQDLSSRERSLVNSVRQSRLSLTLPPTPPQRQWLTDIAARLKIDTTIPKPTLAEFWDLLNRHDWTFAFSDDSSAYNRGCADRDRLEFLTKQSSEHRALFDAFSAHHFSGEPWRTAKVAMPARPA